MYRNIYITYTPYHIFLAMLIALSNDGQGFAQELIIISNFADAQLFYKGLLNSNSNPFSKVTILAGEYHQKELGSLGKICERYFGAKRILADLLRLVKSSSSDEIYLFNEERPYSLGLINYIKSAKDKIRVSLVEDGAITYNSSYIRKDQNYLFLGKVFFGSWWKDVEVQGASEIFECVWVLYPQYVRPELKNKRIDQIPAAGLDEIIKSGMAAQILENYGISPEEVKRFNCIILLSHSSVIKQSPEYKDMVLRVIKRAQEIGYAVAIKYHPRDKGDFLGLANEPNVYCLRSSAPLELIFVLAKNSIKLVIADASTSLLSALLIMPDAKVVSTGALLGSKDSRFLSMVGSLGAKLPKTYEEIGNVL